MQKSLGITVDDVNGMTVDMPIGIVTRYVGGFFFVWLLRRK